MLDMVDAFIKSESEEAQKIKETFRQLCPGKNIEDGFLIQASQILAVYFVLYMLMRNSRNRFTNSTRYIKKLFIYLKLSIIK